MVPDVLYSVCPKVCTASGLLPIHMCCIYFIYRYIIPIYVWFLKCCIVFALKYVQPVIYSLFKHMLYLFQLPVYITNICMVPEVLYSVCPEVCTASGLLPIHMCCLYFSYRYIIPIFVWFLKCCIVFALKYVQPVVYSLFTHGLYLFQLPVYNTNICMVPDMLYSVCPEVCTTSGLLPIHTCVVFISATGI